MCGYRRFDMATAMTQLRQPCLSQNDGTFPETVHNSSVLCEVVNLLKQ